MAIPTIPVMFTKYNNTLIGFQQDISLGQVGEQFNYEIELGMVNGKNCKNVSRDKALDYVLVYCVANELSCRDLQFRSSQWLMGKSLDNFLPLGKYIVTADELSDPQQLQMSCTLNGEIRQQVNTSDMIFTVAEIIEDLLKHMTAASRGFNFNWYNCRCHFGTGRKRMVKARICSKGGDRENWIHRK